MRFTIKQALSWANQKLAGLPSARIDSEILLSLTINQHRIFLITHSDYELSLTEQEQFQTLIESRAQGCPIAYLRGTQEFWSLSFKVTPDVLIPRPETELCVQAALEYIQNPHAHIADIGTGSGCIAIALATERPTWQITATDIHPKALKIARLNAMTHHCTHVVFEERTLLEGFSDNSLDAIVSNPPYIGEDDQRLEQHVRHYEPGSALIAENDGYALLFQIAKQAYTVLKPGGHLILEHGQGQEMLLQKHLLSLGYQEITSKYDLQDIVRVMIARKLG